MINTRYTTATNSIFSQITQYCAQYSSNTNNAPVLSLGVGDTVLPIAPCVATAMADACMQLSDIHRFVGYGSEYGLPQYLGAIQHYYNSMQVYLDTSEIFASDGAISQLCDIMDILTGSVIAVPNPSYPVYRDTNWLAGKTIVALQDDNALSALPTQHVDIIYLCNPTNPTGMCYNSTQLQQWVNYCIEHHCIMIYDSAYSNFVRHNLPRSIYQIPGAQQCCIEICSLSKSASFTGIRCGYTVVPHALTNANKAWRQRLSYKTNGVGYIAQIGASMALSECGLAYSRTCIDYYHNNATRLQKVITANLRLQSSGGIHSPYLWVHCPQTMDSWQLFHYLLDNYGIVTLPGVGMGTAGQGHIRVSSFCLQDTVTKIEERLSNAETIW